MCDFFENWLCKPTWFAQAMGKRMGWGYSPLASFSSATEDVFVPLWKILFDKGAVIWIRRGG